MMSQGLAIPVIRQRLNGRRMLRAILYVSALKAFGQNDKTLSLYIHIPFCEQLCYFCACNKVIRAKDEKVGDEFLEHLFKEIDMVAGSHSNVAN